MIYSKVAKMKFISNIDINKFNDFVLSHPYKSHFLQSSLWGELSKHKGLTPHYVGIIDKGEIIAASLLLEKKLYFGYSYLYAPRGYVIDFNNYKTLSFFTEKIKKYAQKRKALFVKIDPDIKYHQIDIEGNKIKKGFNNYQTFADLTQLGYKHKGFNKNFESSQPRYTFRIDFNDSFENISARFSTTTKQRIKKAKEYGIEVYIGDESDIDSFYQLVLDVEKRKNLFQHSYKYYYEFYNILKKNDNVKLFIAKAYPSKIVAILKNKEKTLRKEIKELEQKKGRKIINEKKQLLKQLNKLNEDLILFTHYKNKYPEGVVISAHMIVFYGDKGWVLYAGNHHDLTETFANYLVYETHIKYAHENGYKIYDQFGSVGDLSKHNPSIGLYEFKKKFGGEFIEFIGEFDLIINKYLYFIFIYLIPLYRKVVRFILRIRRPKK